MEQFYEVVGEIGWSVRLAIADAIAGGKKLSFIQERLWCHNPEQVRDVYKQITRQRSDLLSVSDDRHYGKEDEEQPKAVHTSRRIGLRVAEFAGKAGIPQATLTALLEHHGFLELVPYGGLQRRRLVPDNVVEAGYGHNVVPSNRIGHLEGYNTAATFPVFYEEKIADILWCLNYQEIVDKALSIHKKQDKLKWLLNDHPYLPQAELAALSGYSERGVRKAIAQPLAA